MNLTRKYFLVGALACPLLSLAQTNVSVNWNMKHSVNGVSDFNREKHITLHSALGEPDWNGEYDKMNYLMNDLDVYFGRDNGSSTWKFKATPMTKEAVEYPDNQYPDMDEMVNFGQWCKDQYEMTDAVRLQFESRSKEMIHGTNPHPTYPTLSWHPGAWTETDPSWSPLLIETSADWVTQYLDKFFAHSASEKGEPLPKYWEVINEPDMIYMTGSGMHTSLEQIFEYHNLVAQGVKARLGDKAPLIGGMTWGLHDLHKQDGMGRFDCGMAPANYHPELKKIYEAACQTEYTNHGAEWFQWDAEWKGFMDAAGANMDFYSIHLYDWLNWETGAYSTQRTGGHVEATLDMVDWYQHYKYGESKPIVISEYWAIVDQTKLNVDPKYQDWANLRTFSNMLMQFLERPDLIVKSMPFAPVKAEWGDYVHEGTFYRYPITMMNKDDQGEWQWREIIKWYELWSEVKGTRIDTKATDVDVQVDAYVDGKDAYLILNNLELSEKTIALYSFGLENNSIVNISTKRLFLDTSLGDKGQPVLKKVDYDKLPKHITMAAEETMILKISYKNDVVINETNKEQKYYGEALNGGVEPLRVKGELTAEINNVSIPQVGEAQLRICGSWPANWVVTSHKEHTISINGHKLELDMDWRGNTSDAQWFGVLELDVPMEYLQANNTVHCKLVGEGTYANVSLRVWDFSTQPGRNSEIEVLPIELPNERIEAENYHDQSGVSANGGIVESFGTGDWMDYNVNALIAGDYNLAFNYATDRSGIIQIKTYVDGSTTPIVTDLTSTGGWGKYLTKAGVAVNLSAGAHKIRIEAVNDINLNYFSLTNNGIIPVSSIELNKSSLIIEPGKSANMLAVVSPKSATDNTVTWSSSDERILTVNAEGIVTGVKEGTAQLTASAQNGTVKAMCAVTVKANKVTGLALSSQKLSLPVGAQKQILATIFPSNATDKLVVWETSNNQVATVDENGFITAVSQGTATITAKTNDGNFTAACTVDVKIVNVESVQLSNELLGLKIGGVHTLTASVVPADASNRALKWSSDNTAVLTVVDGVLTAKGLGSANVTVTSVDGGKTAVCKVSVKSNDSWLVIEAESFTTTGGVFDDSKDGGPGNGVAIDGGIINYVNSGDWTEYQITIPASGQYQLSYLVACPSNNANITILIDGVEIAVDKLPNNGLESAGWDAYTSIVGSVVNLNAGTSTLKIKAGTEAYAWNLDKIELAKIAEVATDVDVVSSSKVEFYPNPANDVLNVSGLQGEYYQFTITNMAGVPVISSSFNGLDNAKVDISKLTDGMYLLNINNSTESLMKKFYKISK